MFFFFLFEKKYVICVKFLYLKYNKTSAIDALVEQILFLKSNSNCKFLIQFLIIRKIWLYRKHICFKYFEVL